MDKVILDLMKKTILSLLSSFLGVTLLLSACQPATTTPPPAEGKAIKVIAVETFLADIAQNIAGDRVKVGALAPIGVDPHEFEPAPQDMARIADSQVIIVNGAGVEG